MGLLEGRYDENVKTHENRSDLKGVKRNTGVHILSHFRATLLLCESGPAETRLAVYRRVVGPTSLSAFCPKLAVNICVTFGFCKLKK